MYRGNLLFFSYQTISSSSEMKGKIASLVNVVRFEEFLPCNLLLSIIFHNYPLLSLFSFIVTYFPLLSPILLYCPTLSRIVLHCPRLSLIVPNCSLLSFILPYCPLLSLIFPKAWNMRKIFPLLPSKKPLTREN